MRVEETDVVIAGAGPAGLMAAAALARHGVRSTLVERRRRLSALPRATAVSTRSMELLRGLGLEDEVRAHEVDARWQGLATETLASAGSGEPFSLGFPSREASALVSPTGPACVPQDELEPALMRHLRATGLVRVAMGAELALAGAGADGVRAAVRPAGGGPGRELRARYLIAADGARSAVRAALGIPMAGPDDLGRVAAAVVRAPLWDVAGPHRHVFYEITGPGGAGVMFPAGRGDRWCYAAFGELGAGELAGDPREVLAARLRAAAGAPWLRPAIERIGEFAFAAQVAARFREGDVFLVGDAAHRMTPRGGTGMNTAIHDGWDLGWKLAWVLRGWAGPALLDSYEAERRPVAEQNVARSADPDRDVNEALGIDLGGRLPHLWVRTPAGRASTLDLLGPGLTLLAGPGLEVWRAAAAAVPGPLPLDVRGLEPAAARALGIPDGGALLTRPDGVTAGWWPHAEGAAAGLRAAVRAAGAGGSGPQPVADAGLGHEVARPGRVGLELAAQVGHVDA